MDEKAELLEKVQELEHICQQLSAETETIGIWKPERFSFSTFMIVFLWFSALSLLVFFQGNIFHCIKCRELLWKSITMKEKNWSLIYRMNALRCRYAVYSCSRIFCSMLNATYLKNHSFLLSLHEFLTSLINHVRYNLYDVYCALSSSIFTAETPFTLRF